MTSKSLDDAIEAVGLFMHIGKQYIAQEPALPYGSQQYSCGPKTVDGYDLRQLRRSLLTEEYDEYMEAENDGDILKIADALADMLVIIFGTALTYGINLDNVFALVMRNNFEKFPNGVATWREDGKIAKPEGFKPLTLTLDDLRIVWTDENAAIPEDTIYMDHGKMRNESEKIAEQTKAVVAGRDLPKDGELGTLASYISSLPAPQHPEPPTTSTAPAHESVPESS